jgi:integrase
VDQGEVVKMASIAKRARNKRNPYVVRYRDPSGRQREEAFRTYREAQHRKAQVEHSTATGTYADPSLARVSFADYAAQVIARMDISPGTRKLYMGMLNYWLAPWANGRTVGQIAEDRAGVADLINGMRGKNGKLLGDNRRGIARGIILAVIGEAVAEGKISSHKLARIKLVRADAMPTHDDFVFPTYPQISALADALNGYGLAVWIARACGLRIREALAVERGDFRERGTVLRVSRQASIDGSCAEPLKYRRAGQFRDVPVPAYLWAMVKSLPAGPVCPSGNGTLYPRYQAVYRAFTRESAKLGIPPQFTPHSLRHCFATALLRAGVPIHIVSQYLGHKGVEITSRVYAHVLPSDIGMVRGILDREFAEWQHAASLPAVA